jgi:CSLREA domain-containing protein
MVLNGWRRWFPRRSLPSRKSRSFRPLLEVLEDRRLLAAFVVNSAGDDPDGNYLAPYNDHIGDTGHSPLFDSDGSLIGFTPFSGLCTLRAAIQQANADGVPATITFDPGVTTIFTAGLPIITVPVVIDGTNVAGKPGVELVGGGGNGLALVAGGSTVKGMVIHSFAGAGIALSGGGGNVIQNNYLGTDVTGTVALPNAVGVGIDHSAGTPLGGTSAAARNLISGNSAWGISIFGFGPSASGNVVEGNFIGTDVTGLAALGNGQGVTIGAFANTIGGTGGEATRNIISGNTKDGVFLQVSATGNVVEGNYIGTDKTGTIALPNLLNGVEIAGASTNMIGGDRAVAGNVISGNGEDGVLITGAAATMNVVQGNFIGTQGDCTSKLGNGWQGVLVTDDASLNTIGGTADGTGNTIAFNGSSIGLQGHGVEVASGISNAIRHNSIYKNEGRGIDLGNDSFTLNDLSDADAGANNLQNYPVVTGVSFNGDKKKITFRLDIPPTPLSWFHVDFFANTEPNGSGFGDGEKFLFSRDYQADLSGHPITFTEEFAATDTFIATTATDQFNNTSEFSLVDTDGDGLADAWEKNGPELWARGGIDLDEDGTVDFRLQSVAGEPPPDPNHKDLFVEVDALGGRGALAGKLAPTQATLNMVRDGVNGVGGFANAPNANVQNPDGRDGVNLHVLLDETNLHNAVAMNDSFPNTWADFDAFKAAHFGTTGEQGKPTVLAAKALVYRYCVFANTYGGSGSSGLAELGGNDFIVALGGGFPEDAKDAATTWRTTYAAERADQQAATFLHELGHTLGLHHGGGDDINGKPNYLSVMRYGHQFNEAGFAWGVGVLPFDQLIRTNRPLDYSHSALPTLQENGGLNEAAGIQGPVGLLTLYGSFGQRRIGPSDGAIDWNSDLVFGGRNVTSDVNWILDKRSLPPSPGQALTGYDDWSNLVYDFRSSARFPDGQHGDDAGGDEETDADYLNGVLGGQHDLSIHDVRVIEGNSGTAMAVFTVSLLPASDQAVTVDYATADGAATAGSDYLPTRGTLTFPPGTTSQTITVLVKGDTLAEPDKSFFVNLSNPSQAVLVFAQGVGTIRDSGSTTAATATEGVATGDQVVATFTAPFADSLPGDFSALISWDDGTTSAGIVRQVAGTRFEVLGHHTYSEAGTYTTNVQVTAADGTSLLTHNTTFTVANAPLAPTTSTITFPDREVLTATGLRFRATARRKVTGSVATFSDTNLQNVAGNFTASIDWGDRTAPSRGTVTLSGRTFFVTGSHTFRRPGKYKVTVTIRDEGGTVVTSVSHVQVLRGSRRRSRRKPTK